MQDNTHAGEIQASNRMPWDLRALTAQLDITVTTWRAKSQIANMAALLYNNHTITSVRSTTTECQSTL
jgi:hypothetical protein